MRRVFALALLLGGCGQEPPRQPQGDGARLESTATALGLVADPRRESLTGSWALETDRACVVPQAGGASRIGVLVDYGDGQGCAASGTVKRDGKKLDVQLESGAGACGFRARFDGSRILFPPDVPAECLSLCTGRATLAALAVERISQSQSEAENLLSPSGRRLCGAP